MAHYRIYLLDDYGKIFVGSDAECATDADALDRAAGLLAAAQDIADQSEVWCGARCVGSVSAEAVADTRRASQSPPLDPAMWIAATPQKPPRTPQ
jgi:hypothetical protein